MKNYTIDNNEQMFLSVIIELYPTEGQKEKLYEYILASNYLYDKVVEWCDDKYVDYLNDEVDSKILSKYDANKLLAEIRKTDPIINHIPLHICRDAIYNGIEAYKRYLYELSNHPLKHYPDNITYSLSVGCSNGEHFYVKNSYVAFLGFNDKSSKGKRVGKIKCQNLGIDSSVTPLYNASIYIDNFGKYYLYATRKVERTIFNTSKTQPIGIDLGYRLDGSNTIVCSDGSVYCQPDTTALQYKIQHRQALVSKDYENRKIKAEETNVSIDNIPLSNREQDNLVKFQRSHRKLYDTLDTFYNQATADIVKKNPEAIIIEDTFVAELKTRRNLIDYGVTSAGKIRVMLLYKAYLHKIPVYVAHRNFKSSYICSKCSRINHKDLKQKKIFKCEYCGYEIDRDLNAAINLQNIYNLRNSALNYNDYIKEIIV